MYLIPMSLTEHYFTQVTWIDRTRLAAVWLRRTQNFSVVSVCHERNGWACDTNLEETSKTGWVDMYDAPLFTADKKYYFLRLPVMTEMYGSFRHIAMISINEKRKRFLTEGAYDVIQIVAHRHEVRKVYYISTLKNKSGQRHLFSITDLTSSNRSKECLTCAIGDNCLFNSATFSPGAKFYILECLGPGMPRLELRAVDGNKLLLEANVRLLLPPGLRDDEVTQYPMVVYVDGGPGHQLVTERFEVHWGTYLASRKNFIYATIDGRGSGNRGDQILHQIYKKLGSVEIEDQITVSSIIQICTDYVFFIRICAVSVFCISDSVYTERYMQSPSPDQNFLAYEKSSLVKKAANLKGKKFLLIHGSNDDKVHLQQSMILIKALTDAEVLFQTQIYPDENHNLANVPLHFYQTMEAFFDQCFNIPRKGGIGLQKTSKKVFIGGR
ncbi:dipeptidyl peptidase 4-like [Limulus polyphemus]|uniref:Dipeptidyl peptidase 4-like n=1 Tax=Limulus polyphemus TaxID=6850 RepID=A0ABM1SDQ9_LIMPO|nr:dipeptidyl peptidase 4-like [Limulus polyphemus]